MTRFRPLLSRIHGNAEVGRRGFSLVEVVIAIAIAGIAFIVLTETFFNVLLTLDSLEEETDFEKDIRFVRREIISLPDREQLEDGGTITTLDHGPADWEAQLEETDILDLFKLKLTITFAPPEADPLVYEETLHLLRPTWSDPISSSGILAEAKDRIEEQKRGRDW